MHICRAGGCITLVGPLHYALCLAGSFEPTWRCPCANLFEVSVSKVHKVSLRFRRELLLLSAAILAAACQHAQQRDSHQHM